MLLVFVSIAVTLQHVSTSTFKRHRTRCIWHKHSIKYANSYIDIPYYFIFKRFLLPTSPNNSHWQALSWRACFNSNNNNNNNDNNNNHSHWQALSWQACFNTPRPPNLGLSRQLRHLPQSSLMIVMMMITKLSRGQMVMIDDVFYE